MNSFVDEYLRTKEEDHRHFNSSVLHYLKFAPSHKVSVYFNRFNFDCVNDDTRQDLVRLATMVSHAYYTRLGYTPSWANDSRLRLQQPYFGRGWQDEWFFFAPQAMYRHNCFFDPGSLEVM